MIKQNNKHKLLLSFIVVVLMLILPLGSGLADEQAIPQTGFEKSNGARWTTHQEELDFLEELSQKSNRIRYTLEGTTGEGRPLHLVRVGDPLPATDEEIASGRTILIVGTFHGNEPSGREMALKLMRDLAFTEEPDMLELMSKSTILFIPTVNPDGREANVRRNKDDFDLNRDAITLKTPEVQTLARIQKQFKPDLILDAHERTSGPNLSLLGGLSLNMDDALYELNADLVDNYLFPQLEDAGFTVEYYPPSGRPTNTRGMAGLKHSIAVLVEASWTDDFSRRVEGQMKSAELILQYYHDHFDQIGQVVSAAPNNKKEIGANRSQPFYLDGMRGLGGTEDELPPESAILNPPPCGYLINGLQKDKISRQIDLFEIETEPVNGGYFITMAQPMMTVIPLILDENSEFKLVNGLAVDDCADLNSLTPPSNPIPQQYQTDFEGYEVGEAPHDWTSFWADSGWTIKDNPSRLEHMVTEGEGRRLLTWNEVGEVHGDVEVAALVRADSDGQLFQLHLHSSGKVDSETSYYLDVFKTPSANNIRINRLIGGRHTELINAELPFPLEVDTWYQVVFQREGTTLKGKVWPYGQEEPSSWQVTFDDIYIDYGHVGVGHVSAGMINDWKFLSVGTYGAEAVRAPDDLIGGVDKSVLQRRVEQIKAENLNEAYYTTESWQNLQTALNRAEELLNKSDATQVEIDEALENLYKAYLALSAQYQTDFSEYASGSVPEDWSTLWRESGWTIKDNPSRLEHFVTEGGKRRVLTWEKVGDVNGDVEVSAVVRRIPTEQSGGVMFQLHLQGSGNAGSESSYYLDLTNAGKVRINRNLNGGFTSLKSADVPFTTQTNMWYQVVFKREGTSLKGKVWPYGEDEPADWQVEVEDGNFVRGKVGVGHVTSGVLNEWAFFGVGTGDVEAPRAPDNLFDGVVDKTALEQAVNAIKSEGLNEDDYTAESWQNLQTALSVAEELLNSEDVTQSELDTALENVNQAYSALQTVSAQYQTDFSEYNLGEVPKDWSILWRDSGWTVRDKPSRLEHFVTEGGKRRVLTWDKAGDVNGDVELSAVVRRTNSDEGVMFQLHLQGSGNAGSENSYYLDLNNSGNVRINRNLNGSFSSLKSSKVPFTVQTDIWYQVVFKREGNSLKGKVWPYGEDEPADWQVEVEDGNFVRGKVGVGHVTSGVLNEWAFFGVGIGQMEAPRAPGNLFEPTEPGVDKTALQAKVNEINEELADGSLVEDDYTLESWQALQEKLTAAQTVLGNDEATQIEVDQALAALETARTGLKLKESPATRPLLQNLEIPGVTLSPTFTPEITKYRGTVTNDVYQITIKASVTDDVYQQVMFNPDNPVNLDVGENTLTVKVIDANDIDLYTIYEIIITREPSSGNGGDDNSDGDNGDDNGSGGSGDSSGGGSSNQEKKPDEDKPKPSTGFIITPKDIIGKAKDGKVTVEVGAETEIQLPVNILELLNSSDVEVQGNRVTLVLPNEVLQQLSKLVAANELEDAHISLTFGSVDHAESERLLTRAENTGNVTLQQASDILDLSLSITTKDGQVNNLTRFEKPITITFTINQGLNTNLLGVYFIADNGSLEYIGGTLSNGTISVDVDHFSKYGVLEFRKTYTDVPSNHWAMNVIQELSAKHIIKGINEREFAPNLHVTRAEFAALIARSLGLQSTKPVTFSDVNSDAWYAKEVAAAAEAGIVAGLSETIFAPDVHINREQMAAMIVRAYEYMLGEEVNLSIATKFDDDMEISPWAKGYVNAAAELGFVQGRGNNEFVAKGLANRAEAAQIIYNFLK